MPMFNRQKILLLESFLNHVSMLANFSPDFCRILKKFCENAVSNILVEFQDTLWQVYKINKIFFKMFSKYRFAYFKN